MGETIMSPTLDVAPAKTAWIERVLGISAPVKAGAKDALAGLKARLARAIAELKTLDDPKIVGTLAKLAAQANDAIKADDAATTLSLLGRIEEGLAAATRAREGKTATARGVVSYRKLQLDWRNAETGAISTLETLGKQVLAHPDIKSSPLYGDVESAVTTLPSLIPTFSETLSDALDAIESASDDTARRTATTAAREALARYNAALDDDGRLEELEAFAGKNFGGLAVLATLQNTLNQIDTAIAV